jgi:hypothetical protein
MATLEQFFLACQQRIMASFQDKSMSDLEPFTLMFITECSFDFIGNSVFARLRRAKTLFPTPKILFPIRFIAE